MPTGSDPSHSIAEELFEEVLHALRRAGPRVPLATYRLQLHAGFGFEDAVSVLDHLATLGVSDVYTSPFLRARAGSQHGYDITSHEEANPELGGAEGLAHFTQALAHRKLGLVLDFVPNHMGVGSDNAWWMDVLENGPSSLFAPYFDIDWCPHKADLENKVLLPILGDPYGRVLERGELVLRHEQGAFFIDYWAHRLPVNPRTYVRVLEPTLAPLIAALGDEDESVLELQSILTGLRHLPPRTELHRARVKERRREKEILKRRLTALLETSTDVAHAIDASVERINGQQGVPDSYNALEGLLEDQSYRLSFWRTAAEEINYRRFFDINDLAAIRVERPEVFHASHAFLFQLMRNDVVTGIRIDHPDGLWDPGGYFQALQRRFFLERCRKHLSALRGEDDVDDLFELLIPYLTSRWEREVESAPTSSAARPTYLLVEKILSRGESLPASWPVHGTTGYDFAADVGAVFTDPEGDAPLTRTWTAFAGRQPAFDELVYRKKKLVLETSLASELTVLSSHLDRLSERDRHTRDFTLGSLRSALREVIACFPVYRTYVTGKTIEVDERDRRAVLAAVRAASKRNAGVDASIFLFIRDLLLLDAPSSAPPETLGQLREFVLHFQQLTGPVMAKGLEDTTFYIWNKLVSLNEVGGEPERFGLDVPSFHRTNAERQERWPYTMLGLSTHDTKRSADVRARIGVLSEITSDWTDALTAAAQANIAFKRDADGLLAPDRNEEYLLYQTVLGALPFEGPGGDEHAVWVERLVAYMLKATKEAKVHTSWINAAPDYDAALERFVRDALAADSPMWSALADIAGKVAFHGAFSSLSQTLLQLTSPGVPDIYQGNESWDFSLVDPDNRRPVDYQSLRQRLNDVREHRQVQGYARGLVDSYEDGRIKTLVVHAALDVRRRHPDVFGVASKYVPLDTVGEQERHVVAFSRESASSQIVAVAPRLTARLASGHRKAPLAELWTNTNVHVPQGSWRDVFTLDEHQSNGTLSMTRLLAHFPVALLERVG